MNNLFVSYDLYRPDRDYSDLFKRIKSLGVEHMHVKLTLWYVKTNLTAASARDQVWAIMEPQDKLIVINTSGNEAAWCGLDAATANYMVAHWPN